MALLPQLLLRCHRPRFWSR